MDRMRRVNELIQRELGTTFERDICPNLETLVTVTNVQTTPDLRQCRVFVSVYGSEEQQHLAMSLIHKQRNHIQKLMGQHIKLKYTPKLYFELDTIQDQADNVLQLLGRLEVEEHLSDDEEKDELDDNQ